MLGHCPTSRALRLDFPLKVIRHFGQEAHLQSKNFVWAPIWKANLRSPEYLFKPHEKASFTEGPMLFNHLRFGF
nr:MAG TPA: hypothetical protein [Caudoviricetes sp.]